MQARAIAQIEIDSSGFLLVSPQADDTRSYEYTYREANGLRWNGEKKALFAYEPSRWKHEELLRHVADTVRSACDEDLCFTEQTKWVGVSPQFQELLRRAIEQRPGTS